MKNCKVCIFDMDGLMIDSERVIKEAYIRAGAQMGLVMSEEKYWSMIGVSAKVSCEMLSEYFPGADIALLRERMHYIKDEIYAAEGVRVKKGLYRLFDYLEQQEIKRIVATSTSKTLAVKMLQEINIYHRLDGMVFGDEVKNSKPAPDIFLRALELSGVTAQQAIVLEDSYNGIRAANNALISAVMIPDLLPPRDDLNTAAVLDNLEKVIAYLET